MVTGVNMVGDKLQVEVKKEGSITLPAFIAAINPFVGALLLLLGSLCFILGLAFQPQEMKEILLALINKVLSKMFKNDKTAPG